jgi:hypothetical protein
MILLLLHTELASLAARRGRDTPAAGENGTILADPAAIVLMDTAQGVLNSNVLIEIGGMLMTGRRCAILRDKSVPQMPADLVGHIQKPTDLADHNASVNEIHKWIRDDLALGECEACPTA